MAFKILVNDIFIHLFTVQKVGSHLKSSLFLLSSLSYPSPHEILTMKPTSKLRKLEVEGNFLNLIKGSYQRTFNVEILGAFLLKAGTRDVHHHCFFC